MAGPDGNGEDDENWSDPGYIKNVGPPGLADGKKWAMGEGEVRMTALLKGDSQLVGLVRWVWKGSLTSCIFPTGKLNV